MKRSWPKFYLFYLNGTRVTSCIAVPQPRMLPTWVNNFNIEALKQMEAKDQNQDVGVNSLTKFHTLVASCG